MDDDVCTVIILVATSSRITFYRVSYRIVSYRIVSYRCIAQLLFILSIVVDILSRSVGGTFYGIHLVAKLIYREKARMKNKELAIFHDNDFYFIFIFYRFNTTPTRCVKYYLYIYFGVW